MEPYAGFEPQVGEIRALRTFRIGPGGSLLPLFGTEPWVGETNTARCRRRRPDEADIEHLEVPDPDCTCGFYAYGSETAVIDYPHARHVLAVVACWGRVIAGTRGVRAEHCRVEALWLSESVPTGLVDQLRERYPSVTIYQEQTTMFAEHPLTVLDCYDPQEAQHQSQMRRWLLSAVMFAVLASAVPATWDGIAGARVVWAAALAFFLVGAVAWRRGRPIDMAVRRRRLLCQAVALWMIAPFAGAVGILLLRIPLVQVGVLMLFHRWRLARGARQFPADLG